MLFWGMTKLEMQLAGVAIVFGTLLSATNAFGQGHNYVNTRRSGTVSHFFVSQSIDGEFGKFTVRGHETLADGSKESVTSTPNWQGFGIGTTFGLEVMKFIQFNAGHTFVNMRSKSDGLEQLDGSRLNAGARFVFAAPIGNLEAGGGVLASRLNYQKRLDSASFYGSGYYYTLGMNYFISSQVSFFGQAKMNQEHLIRGAGSDVTTSMSTATTLLGCGFTLWL